jgi:hypothetical protein
LQRTESFQQIAGQIHGRFAFHANSQKNRQQFSVGKARRSPAQQLLARLVVGGPEFDAHV